MRSRPRSSCCPCAKPGPGRAELTPPSFMPLTAPVERQPMHSREIRCQGFLRGDGLWDIEAHLVDTKPYDMPNADRPHGKIAAGEHLHEMWIRLTVDSELWVH